MIIKDVVREQVSRNSACQSQRTSPTRMDVITGMKKSVEKAGSTSMVSKTDEAVGMNETLMVDELLESKMSDNGLVSERI